MATVQTKRRVSKSDWLEAGLRALSTGGVHSVRVDLLARQLGVARSGFYWHFENRDELLADMLDYWARELTQVVTENLGIVAQPAADRLLTISKMIIDHDLARYDSAVRQWSREDPAVARVARKVFGLRLDLLARTFGELGFEGEEREMRVRLFHIYHSAEGEAIPPMSKAERRRMAEIRAEMLTRR